MKKFRFKLSPIVWILTSIILVMLALGLYWNIFNLTEFGLKNNFKTFSYLMLAIITAGLMVFAISLLINSKYQIKNGYLFTYFGFIRSKINISEIVAVTHFKKSDKLVIYLKEQSYSVIVISPDNYGPFVLALREHNKEILYDVKIDGEDTAL